MRLAANQRSTGHGRALYGGERRRKTLVKTGLLAQRERGARPGAGRLLGHLLVRRRGVMADSHTKLGSAPLGLGISHSTHTHTTRAPLGIWD